MSLAGISGADGRVEEAVVWRSTFEESRSANVAKTNSHVQLDDTRTIRAGTSGSAASASMGDDDTEDSHNSHYGSCCVPLEALTAPVEVGQLMPPNSDNAFLAWPLLGPLLFENSSSDVRDGLANERTFLSYLRLSVTMAVMAVAIVISFHLKRQPSPMELRMAMPLGIIFWLLSIVTLVAGMANYIKTINKYSRRMALVQTGWKTQSIMAVVATAIFGSCVTLLVINKLSENED